VNGCAIRTALLWVSLAAFAPASIGAQTEVRESDAPLRVQVSLPEAPSVDVARSACAGCHGAGLIVGQRLTRLGWDREVAKMERWSSPVPSPDRDRLIDYLSGRFGVTSTPMSIAVPGARGREIHDRACLTCHDDGLARSQRLTVAGWRRTVVKMVGWGARVSPEDVEALVAFLEQQAARPADGN